MPYGPYLGTSGASRGHAMCTYLVDGTVDERHLVHGALPSTADLRNGGGVGHHEPIVPQQLGAVDPAVLVGPLEQLPGRLGWLAGGGRGGDKWDLA